MFSYNALNQAFPWKLTTTRTSVRYLVRKLIDPDRILLNPSSQSSFAITTDAPDGMWNLWLSEESKKYLIEHMSHISNNLIDTSL